MRAVHLVAPAGLNDPRRPSGGNRYDLAVVAGLRARDWTVTVHEVRGPWPDASRGSALDEALARVPAGAVAVVDGLVGSAAGSLLAGHARRLSVVLLVHMPLSADHDESQAAAVGAATVVATSEWTRRHLLQRHPHLPAARVVVCPPGVDPAPETRPSASGHRLLTVGAVTHVKGTDRVVTALGGLRDLRWRWRCVGSAEVEPEFAAAVAAAGAGLEDRVVLTGPLGPDALAAEYADADLLVLGSRAESFGMAATEALARGVPVLAPRVGGLAEALGTTRPPAGLLVPPDDPRALTDALRRWLGDADLRARLRDGARQRRSTLPSWDETVTGVETAVRAAGSDQA